MEVATLASSGANSSLGAPTTNATIGLGGASTSGTLRYIGGTDNSTARRFDLGSNAGGGFDAAGQGAITVTGSVTGGSRDASTNDVLRLTDATSPFASSLTSQNVVNVLFNLASGTAPVVQGTCKGGFFSDAVPSFSGAIANGLFTYRVSGSYGNGSIRDVRGYVHRVCGIVRAPSPDVRCGHPVLRSLGCRLHSAILAAFVGIRRLPRHGQPRSFTHEKAGRTIIGPCPPAPPVPPSTR